jgi:hypothetical protein
MNRLDGIPPKIDFTGATLKLSRPEEKALCCYVDRLNHLNLAVWPEFITDAVNAILQARSSKNTEAPEVSKHYGRLPAL